MSQRSLSSSTTHPSPSRAETQAWTLGWGTSLALLLLLHVAVWTWAGVACALAMLGKYYSSVLLASMLVTALALPAWRRRFATPLPWIAIGTLLLCLLPHLNWLLSQTEGPIQYAQSAAHESPSAASMRALHFGLSQWVFPLLAFGLLAVSLQPGQRRRAVLAALTSLVRPRREAAWWLAVMPIVATMLATVITGARTASVWGLPIAAGVSVLVMSRARDTGARIDLRRTAWALGTAWLLVAALAPALWLVAARLDAPSASEPREEMAREVDRLWRAEFNEPLPWVTGTRALAASVAFYADSHPRYWSAWNVAHETPWAEPKQVFADGGVIVCADSDRACADIGAGWSQRRLEITAAKQARGFSFAPRRYLVYLLPPRASGQLPDGD